MQIAPNVSKVFPTFSPSARTGADVTPRINSSLVYELSFLKNYAMQLLLQIDNTVPEYSEARRLIRFLDYFLPVMDIDVIPSTSIIREFIGNSYFNY
jgi:uridine kinase